MVSQDVSTAQKDTREISVEGEELLLFAGEVEFVVIVQWPSMLSSLSLFLKLGSHFEIYITCDHR